MEQEPNKDDILAITMQLILARVVMISNLVASITLIITNDMAIASVVYY